VNVQNLSGKELYGVNMRKTVIAGPGKKLCAADLEQIEPRCGCWFADEREALIELAAGVSPYIVYARQAMGLAHNETWAKSDPRYKVAKEAVLGCGYSMGHHKFVITIEGKVPQGRLTEDEVVAILDSPLEWEGTEEKYFDYIDSIKRPQWLSFYQKQDTAGQHRLLKGWEIVMTFRNGRPKLVTLWKSLGQAAKEAAARGEDLELGLPSGRSLIYKKCRFRRKPKTEESPEGGHDIVADITRNGIPQTTKIHSGILIENMCQAMARDSFRDCLLRVHDAGYKVLFHVHDELIVELDEDGAEEAKLDIERIMGIHPTWAPTLPVAAEATLADSYDQAK
jgi:DNA polymerase